MQLLGKQVGQITHSEILALISRAVSEGVEIEYKRDLPGNLDADKHEYLADVSAMAKGRLKFLLCSPPRPGTRPNVAVSWSNGDSLGEENRHAVLRPLSQQIRRAR